MSGRRSASTRIGTNGRRRGRATPGRRRWCGPCRGRTRTTARRSTGARACPRRARGERVGAPGQPADGVGTITVNYNEGNACAPVRRGPGDRRLDWRTGRRSAAIAAPAIFDVVAAPPGARRPRMLVGRDLRRSPSPLPPGQLRLRRADARRARRARRARTRGRAASRCALGDRRADAGRVALLRHGRRRAASSACSRRSAPASPPRACQQAIRGASSSAGCTASRPLIQLVPLLGGLMLMLFELRTET